MKEGNVLFNDALNTFYLEEVGGFDIFGVDVGSERVSNTRIQ